jgi:hypothetical protein
MASRLKLYFLCSPDPVIGPGARPWYKTRLEDIRVHYVEWMLDDETDGHRDTVRI